MKCFSSAIPNCKLVSFPGSHSTFDNLTYVLKDVKLNISSNINRSHSAIIRILMARNPVIIRILMARNLFMFLLLLILLGCSFTRDLGHNVF